MSASDGATLVLEAAGPEAGQLGKTTCRFGTEGGTIGRAEDNDWVLPHGLVSSHHARITYAGGTFYITDTSTNGVFVNSRKNRLTKGEPAPIATGDSIIIEPFRLQAAVLRAQEPASLPRMQPPPPAPQVELPPPDPFRSVEPVDWAGEGPKPVAPSDEVDPLKLLGLESHVSQAPNAPRARDLEAVSPERDHYKPPQVSQPPPPAQVLIPEDYDPVKDRRIEAAPQPPPQWPGPPKAAPRPSVESRRPSVEPVRPPVEAVRPQVDAFRPPVAPARPSPGQAEPAGAGALAALAAVLAGAGLANAPVTPQLATNLGEILRVVVEGVMDMLQARQQIKDEFRMQATRFKQADNNALKFSANVNDALHNLLVKQNPAYLAPVEAFEDAFRDLRNHQLAMLAGMRAAFEAMLADFDPDRLQTDFDRNVKKSILGTKPEYWEMYRQRAQDLVKDVEASFRKLFGDRFGEAYEEQFDRLTEQSRHRKP